VAAGPHECAPGLDGDVVCYAGYREEASASVRRRELPSARVPLIISFGPSIEMVGGTAGPLTDRPLTSFLAGFSDGYAVTKYVGTQYGVQVDLTPLGAYRLLGVAGAEIRDGVVNVDDLLGPALRRAHRVARRSGRVEPQASGGPLPAADRTCAEGGRTGAAVRASDADARPRTADQRRHCRHWVGRPRRPGPRVSAMAGCPPSQLVVERRSEGMAGVG
jgi:hypothetical protein